MNKQSVYEYWNYREFLKSQIEKLTAADKSLSQRKLSRLFGFRASNFLQFVISGEKNLSEQSCKKIAITLKLNKQESHFFQSLVLFNQAEAPDVRELYLKELWKNPGFTKAKRVESLQLEYLSNLVMFCLREMVQFADFEQGARALKSYFPPDTDAQEIQKSIQKLIELRLISQSIEGKWLPTNQNIAIPAGISDAVVFNFHRRMIQMASEALNVEPAQNRDISSSAVAFKMSRLPELAEFLDGVKNEFLNRFAEPKEGDAVVALNLQAIPLARRRE